MAGMKAQEPAVLKRDDATGTIVCGSNGAGHEVTVLRVGSFDSIRMGPTAATACSFQYF